MRRKTNSLDQALKDARDAYNKYFETTIAPLLAISPEERDSLGFADIVRRISDAQMRMEYTQLALTLLRANIGYHEPLATRKELPQPGHVTVVVFTLLAAAVGYYYYRSPVVTLVVAAAAYWFASTADENRLRSEMAEVRDHNNGAHEWKKAIAEWEKAFDELRQMD